jgi:hypothetical protein
MPSSFPHLFFSVVVHSSCTCYYNSFVRRFLTSPSGIDTDALIAENESLKREVENLRAEYERLQQLQAEGGVDA